MLTVSQAFLRPHEGPISLIFSALGLQVCASGCTPGLHILRAVASRREMLSHRAANLTFALCFTMVWSSASYQCALQACQLHDCAASPKFNSDGHSLDVCIVVSIFPGCRFNWGDCAYCVTCAHCAYCVQCADCAYRAYCV